MGFTDKPANSEDQSSHGCRPNEWQKAAESVAGLLWICDEAGYLEALARMGMPAPESEQPAAQVSAQPKHWVSLLDESSQQSALVSSRERRPSMLADSDPPLQSRW